MFINKTELLQFNASLVHYPLNINVTFENISMELFATEFTKMNLGEKKYVSFFFLSFLRGCYVLSPFTIIENYSLFYDDFKVTIHCPSFSFSIIPSCPLFLPLSSPPPLSLIHPPLPGSIRGCCQRCAKWPWWPWSGWQEPNQSWCADPGSRRWWDQAAEVQMEKKKWWYYYVPLVDSMRNCNVETFYSRILFRKEKKKKNRFQAVL